MATPELSFKSVRHLFQTDNDDSPMFLNFNTNIKSSTFDDDDDIDLAFTLSPVSRKIELPEDENSRDSGIDLTEVRDASICQTTPLSPNENDSFKIRRPARKSLSKHKTFDTRRAIKRTASPFSEVSRHTSKRRNVVMDQNLLTDSSSKCPGKQRIMEALNHMANDDNLIGDGSEKHSLPTISGKHEDLKSIFHETLRDMMQSVYKEVIDSYTIVDCRYPYEYEGGHIEGAINLHTREMVEDYFLHQHTPSTKRTVLVFHCEFSSERGPKLLRHLRSCDRAMNVENYPNLFYPEVYLLDGGYKQFYLNQLEACVPQSYKPMVHSDHTNDLRHFRSKTKSMSVLEKRKLRF